MPCARGSWLRSNDLVATVANVGAVSIVDFARQRPVELEGLKRGTSERMQVDSASDFLVVVVRPSGCSVFSRISGRLLWSREEAGLSGAHFVGNSLLVFGSKSEVIKVDWRMQ